MFEEIKTQNRIFWANFSWERYDPYLNGRLAKLALFVPLIGYLILFNDFVAENLDFKYLVSHGNPNNQKIVTPAFSSTTRLQFIYFGLLTLSMASILNLWKRPRVCRQGITVAKYMEFGLTNFTVYDFVNMNHVIQHEGHTSVYGKYYTDDWEAFLSEARWKLSGTTAEKANAQAKKNSRMNVSLSAAKKTHEDLLRSMLIDTYKRETSKRRKWLIASLLIATVGYILLLVPSVELFSQIIFVTLGKFF